MGQGTRLAYRTSRSDTYLYLAEGASFTGQSVLAQDDDSGTTPWNSFISRTGPNALTPGQTYMIECTIFNSFFLFEYNLRVALVII